MAKRKITPGFWWDTDKGIGYVDFRAGGRKGHRVRTTIDHLGYKEALKRFGELRDQALKAARSPRSIPTLSQYWSDFPRLRPIKPSTRECYEYMLHARIFPILGSVRLDRITPAKVLDFRSTIMTDEISAATVNRYVTIVRMLLSEARLRGILSHHPVPPGTVPPLKEAEITVAYLSPSEREALLRAFMTRPDSAPTSPAGRRLGPVKQGLASPLERRYGGGRRGDSESTGEAFERFQAARSLFVCALDTGLSRSDLINLDWHKVDLENRLIRTARTKTGVPVTIPMTKRLLAELQAIGSHPAGTLVFRTVAGGRWAEAIIKRYFKTAKTLAGITRHVPVPRHATRLRQLARPGRGESLRDRPAPRPHVHADDHAVCPLAPGQPQGGDRLVARTVIVPAGRQPRQRSQQRHAHSRVLADANGGRYDAVSATAGHPF